MEQKQLDELDESFFSEEFIDDEPLDVTKTVSSAVKGKADKKDLKKTKVIKNNKQAADSIQDNSQFEVDFDSLEEEKEEIQIKPAKVKETVKPKEVHSTKSSTKAPIETSSPVNPWANDEEKKESSFFEESSTWKVISGILVVLLVFSIITEGFKFSSSPAMKTGSELTLSQAQEKTLTYVNNNLLRPPFFAEAKNTTDINSLYKVSLAVADQNFDTYITKDGKYIFLQGFDTSTSLKETSKGAGKETVTSASSSSTLKPASTKSTTKIDSTNTVSAKSTETPQTTTATSKESTTQPIAQPTTAPKVITVTPTTTSSEVTSSSSTTTSAKKELTLNAKKWFFTPSQLNVNKGDKIVLTIIPDNLDFTFAIPDLDVKQDIKSKTTIEFTATQSGSFDYICSSCEDYRGMTGTLVVQ